MSRFSVCGVAHGAFRHGKARPQGVGGVCHQGQDSCLSQLCKALQVYGVAEYRRIVHLEVSRMQDHACRAVDRQGGCVLDGVVCLNEFHLEVSGVDHVAVGDHVELCALQKACFPELVLDQGGSEPGGIYREVQLPQDIGKGSDVVLMTVGDIKALQLLHVLLQIGHIRYDQVDAQHLLIRERHSAVHHDDAVLILEGRDVHSDLFQASQGDDADVL